MASLRFTNQAVKDLNEIWKYTFENWSELQADKYYNDLIRNCTEIAAQPEIGRPYFQILKNLRGFKVNKHIIFYRQIEYYSIEVLRILHERMDLKSRI